MPSVMAPSSEKRKTATGMAGCDETDLEAKRDYFGGVKAKQGIFCASSSANRSMPTWNGWSLGTTWLTRMDAGGPDLHVVSVRRSKPARCCE